jgi:hypothetical protein
MTSARAARDYRLDFFRGAALFFIFIDHVPSNPLAYATLKSFAFADAAEVFIFISGYTAALVYGRSMLRDGPMMCTLRVWRRVWQLYVAHLCIFMVYTAQVAYAIAHMTNPLFVENLGVGDFLQRADVTIVRVLLLQFQPTYLDILPLYIALLLVFPAFILMMRWRIALAVILSAALYALVQVWPLNLPAYPEDEVWYFNPFAWQFLFVIAAALGFHRARYGDAETPMPVWIVASAIGIAGFACVVQLSWVLHDGFAAVPALLRRQLWPIEKTALPPLRLLSVLALAVLVARFVPRQARFLTSRPGWIVVLCGQHSLNVFCLSILLSVLGGIVLTGLGDSMAMVAVVNAVGMLAMVGLALGMAWFDGGGHLPQPGPQPGSARGAA